MRYLIGEIALYAAICLAAVVGLFVWRSTPVVAILLGLFLAGLVGLILRELIEWFEQWLPRVVRSRRDARAVAVPSQSSPGREQCARNSALSAVQSQNGRTKGSAWISPWPSLLGVLKLPSVPRHALAWSNAVELRQNSVSVA